MRLSLISLVICLLSAGSLPAVEIDEVCLPSAPRQLPADGIPASWKVAGPASFWQGPSSELELGTGARAQSSFTLQRPDDTVFEAKGASGMQFLLCGEVIGDGTARIELFDGVRLLASREIQGRRVVAGLRYRCDSVQPHAGLEKIFDGDPASCWHTHYDKVGTAPHWLEIDLAAPIDLPGLVITSRADRSNGTPGKIRISGATEPGRWSAIAELKTDFHANTRQELPFPAPVRLRYLRLEFPGSEKWYTAFAELELAGRKWPAIGTGEGNAFVVGIGAPDVAKLWNRELKLCISQSRPGAIGLRNLKGFLLPTEVKRSMQAKENGVDGPDIQDFGLLGFQALAIQKHPVLVTGLVRPGLPAAKAGLVTGDLILSVNGVLLPPLELGSNESMLLDSPLAVLGHACESALRSPKPVIRLGLMRAGKPMELDLALPTEFGPGFATGFPALKDPFLDRLENDTKQWLLKHQKPDGCWQEGGFAGIQTPLAGLALLGTRDPACLPAVSRAVDWCMKTPQGSYFPIGLFQMLVAEYHLATGDNRVLPWLDQNLELCSTGSNNTIWQHQGWGHGPGPGLPYGNKGLMGASVHVIAGESLAMRCGLKSRFLESCWDYFHNSWADPAKGENGSMGYNASCKDSAQFWSRTGLSLMALHLRQEHPEMCGPMIAIMKQRCFMFHESHAYGEPGGCLGLAGLACADDAAYHEVMSRLAFHWLIAWEPGYGLRYTPPSMGAPYMGQDGIINPAVLFALSGRHHGLVCTGAKDRGWATVPPPEIPRTGFSRLANGSWNWSPGLGQPPASVRLGPTAASLPLRLDEGGIVTWPEPPAPGFQILSAACPMIPAAASFHPDPVIALRRLHAAIDGDPKTRCFSDAGYEAPYFPQSCEFRKEPGAVLSGIRVDFAEKGGRPDEIRVLVSDDGKSWKPLVQGRPDARQKELELSFDDARLVRFLRLEFHRDDEATFAEELKNHPVARKPGHATETQSVAYEKVKERGPYLEIGNLELLQPVPKVATRADGFALNAPAGFEIRYTVDGSTPTRQSPLAPALISVPASPALCSRLFAADWEGPVLVTLPPKTPFTSSVDKAAAPASASSPLRRFQPTGQ